MRAGAVCYFYPHPPFLKNFRRVCYHKRVFGPWTPAEWALRWVWNHPEVTVVLSGMNDEENIRENIRVAGQAQANSLTGAELNLVKRVESKYRELMKVGCTGCQYCMPCPSGVNIPLCFEHYNNLTLADDPDGEKFMYAARLGGAVALGTPEFASLCVQCGQCVEKCPQRIDIPTVLESVVKELEGPDLEQRVATAKQMFRQTLWYCRGIAGWNPQDAEMMVCFWLWKNPHFPVTCQFSSRYMRVTLLSPPEGKAFQGEHPVTPGCSPRTSQGIATWGDS